MKTLSSKPVHVDSADDDLLARVAAIDVAKDSGMAAPGFPMSPARASGPQTCGAFGPGPARLTN
jgi:hypothetical protein